MKLSNIIVPSNTSTTSSANNTATTYDFEIKDHTITSIDPHTHLKTTNEDRQATNPRHSDDSGPPPSLLLPTLCHPHIHLDKAYLLTSNYNDPLAYPPCCPRSQLSISHNADTNTATEVAKDNVELPDYSSLAPKSGSFPEALQLTSKAKELYTREDLYLRAAQLLATSYGQGVTSARCFVEVDHVTGHQALEVGLDLKKRFEGKVRVQICAFAQDPIFSTEHGEENRGLLEDALEKYAAGSQTEVNVESTATGSADVGSHREIEVLGSTPYVETSREASIKNIEWAITTAQRYNLHLDFHLDYNLDESKKPEDLMIWQVIRLLKERKWPTQSRARTTHGGEGGTKKQLKTIVLGHCTALTLFSHAKLMELSAQIHESGLPIYFVGLPTSDLYMMGRPPTTSESTDPQKDQTKPLHRPRGTLNPLSLQKEYGLSASLAINNVGNAFTPFGSGDPLQLASWGVGLYHGGGDGDAEMLYDCVSGGARRAVGLSPDDEGRGQPAGGNNGESSGGKEGMEGFEVREGQDIGEFGLLLVKNDEYIGASQGVGETAMRVPARRRVAVRDVVWDVPEVGLRSIIR